MNKKLRNIALSLATLITVVAITACTGTGGNNTTTENNNASTTGEDLTEQSGEESTTTTDDTTQSESESGTGDLVTPLHIGVSQYVEHGALDAALQGFIDRLAEHGYIEGENLELTIQNAQAEQANAQTIAQGFATMDLDLILAIATQSAQALANVIKETPILVTAVTDPEDAGLVESNEAPGTNVSGTSDLNPVDQQIDLLTELLPDAETVAIMYASGEQNSILQGEMAIEALESRGLTGVLYTASNSNELQSVIESSVGQVDAWYIPTDNMFASSMGIVRQVAVEAKMPVIIGEKNMMDEGGLATVALDYYALGAETAEMAIEILEDGKNPADMPIRYQEDVEVYVNEAFAAEIDFVIPESVLGQVRSED